MLGTVWESHVPQICPVYQKPNPGYGGGNNREGSAGQVTLPLVSSSSMVVLALSEDSCQREEGGGEEGLAEGGVG